MADNGVIIEFTARDKLGACFCAGAAYALPDVARDAKSGFSSLEAVVGNGTGALVAVCVRDAYNLSTDLVYASDPLAWESVTDSQQPRPWEWQKKRIQENVCERVLTYAQDDHARVLARSKLRSWAWW